MSIKFLLTLEKKFTFPKNRHNRHPILRPFWWVHRTIYRIFPALPGVGTGPVWNLVKELGLRVARFPHVDHFFSLSRETPKNPKKSTWPVIQAIECLFGKFFHSQFEKQNGTNDQDECSHPARSAFFPRIRLNRLLLRTGSPDLADNILLINFVTASMGRLL